MPSPNHYIPPVPPRLSAVDDTHWRNRAACLNHPTVPPWTFDDQAGNGKEDSAARARRIATAVAVCKGCPVRDACLADVDLRFDEGVRGGVDLRKLRAKQRVQLADLPDDDIRHGTEAGAKAHGRRKERACNRCLEGARRAKAERDAAWPAKVPCPTCRKPIRRRDISRHVKRQHNFGGAA